MQRKQNKGFLLLDATIGLAILGGLMAVLAIGLNAQQRISRQLMDARAAWRQAEGALANLQARGPASNVVVKTLAGGNPPRGFVWVETTATQGTQTARLVGLVPEGQGVKP